jgi:hypothetical protein
MKVWEHQPPKTADIGWDEFAIFLAGPIEGSANWQARAVEIFKATGKTTLALVHIFNPRRERDLRDTRLKEEIYKEQTYWEQDHLVRAALKGAHLFWLEAQDKSQPYTKGREYARTTIKEVGMSLGAHFYGHGLKMAVGIDPEFEDPSNTLRYYKTTLNRLRIPVQHSLDDTCAEALALLT